MTGERVTRRFIIELEGDFPPLTQPSDVAMAVDRLFDGGDWRIAPRDFNGEPGCLVDEVVLLSNPNEPTGGAS